MHYRTQCIGVYTHMQSTSVQRVASLISLSMYLITCLLHAMAAKVAKSRDRGVHSHLTW